MKYESLDIYTLKCGGGIVHTSSFCIAVIICSQCISRLLDLLLPTNSTLEPILRQSSHFLTTILSGVLFLWLVGKCIMTYHSTWYICERWNSLTKQSFERLSSLRTAITSSLASQAVRSVASERSRSCASFGDKRTSGNDSYDVIGDQKVLGSSLDAGVAMQKMERAKTTPHTTRESKTA